MSYAGIQMFMNNLNHLILINYNNPDVERQRPHLKLLYDELHSMIQTLFVDPLHKANDLQKIFIYAAHEAEYNVDLFLSTVYIRRRSSFKSLLLHLFRSSDHITNSKPSLNLDHVWRSLKSVQVDIMSTNIHTKNKDSSPRPQRTLNQSVGSGQSSISRSSKKLMDEIFVGIDHDLGLIRDKLVEDQKKVDVVSIVGMGGIGKTTLATKVFNDGYVKHHFYVRVWVTVSQTYGKRAVLIQILASIGVKLDVEKVSDSRLREMVHKNLMGKRYLIVIDDIWNIETWDDLKVFFPHDNNGSRILLTSRLTEVAKHANSDGLIHHLGYLNKERSLELLCQKVFQSNECPEWSIKPGMQIVENCQGLPLALVVIAGVLVDDPWSEKFWKEVAEKTGSYIVGEQNGCLETLGLSYSHLPLHLRECFLYLGGFPEDYKFKVRELIWLWVAEGFIQQDENRSLEDIAEGYLMDLIDRNLVIVVERRNSDGAVKVCKVHDLVRELCLQKAEEERFILQTERLFSSPVITAPYKPVRVFINGDVKVQDYQNPCAQNVRAILCFLNFRYSIDDVAKYFCSFVLLRVLNLRKCLLDDLPKGMESLVHLRYLAVYTIKGFSSSVCNLWNLQTLIYLIYNNHNNISNVLPSNISNLVNLRHLRSSVNCHFPPFIEKPMNLQSISGVKWRYGVDTFEKCFPYIKELTCTTYTDEKNDFQSLTYLEKLKLSGVLRGNDRITFPATLETLTLVGCRLPWTDITIIQSLPNLQVLKLKHEAFKGSCWNTDGQEFTQLKFLRLEELNIKLWEAYSRSFPCLRQLEIKWCGDLEEIPLELGDIPTLELIKIAGCRPTVGESVRRIEEEQHDLGNFDLNIHIIN